MSDFRDTFQKSIYSPEFYADIPKKPLSYSLKYFFSLALLSSFMLAALFAATAVPRLNAFLHSAGPKILTNYPQELEVTIKNHRASTNIQEPYYVPLPQELKDNKNDSGTKQPKNLLVIDTTQPFSTEKFRAYDTVILLTKEEAAYFNNNGAIEIVPLDRVPDLVITKDRIASYVEKFTPFLKFVAPIFVVLIFFGLMLAFSFKLLYLLFGALLVWLVARAKKIQLTYKEAYRASIHLLTWSIIASFFLVIFSPGYSPPFFTSILLVISAIVNLKASAFNVPALEALSVPSTSQNTN